jgi:hypothetical protein
MKQYCVYTQDVNYGPVIEWVVENQLKCEIHLNRLRFWVPTGIATTEFLLRFYHCCSEVIE